MAPFFLGVHEAFPFPGLFVRFRSLASSPIQSSTTPTSPPRLSAIANCPPKNRHSLLRLVSVNCHLHHVLSRTVLQRLSRQQPSLRLVLTLRSRLETNFSCFHAIPSRHFVLSIFPALLRQVAKTHSKWEACLKAQLFNGDHHKANVCLFRSNIKNAGDSNRTCK